MQDKLTNPFPGLRSFEQTENLIFFGRQKQIDQLSQKLSSARFLMVIGAARSGKSSLVKAGLVPSLKNTEWHNVIFRPENSPLNNLAAALAKESNLPKEDILKFLTAGENGLLDFYKKAYKNTSKRLLIVVDNFDDLFRLATSNDDESTGIFINLLLNATQKTDTPISVLITMRSEYLGNCAEFNGLSEAINNGQYLLSRLHKEEIKDAIIKPAALNKVIITDELVAQLLNEVEENPKKLALLSHLLKRMWNFSVEDSPGKSVIDVNTYEQVGTLDHALSQHLEETFTSLKTESEQQTAKAIFNALVMMAGTQKGTRRPRLLAELCELADKSEAEVKAVTEVFRDDSNQFLTPSTALPLHSSTLIDIAHESILNQWERLATWVEDEDTAAQTYLRLCDAAVLYEAGKGGLLRDPELQVAWKWKEEQQPNELWAARYNNLFDKALLFLDYSKTQFEKEQVFKEKMQKQRLRRAKRISIIISIIALVSFLLAIYAFELKNVAKKQTIIAEKESVEAKRQRKLAQEQEFLAKKSKESALLSAKLALDQKNIAQSEQEKALKSEKNALLQKTIAEQQKAYADRQKVIAENNATLAKQQQSIAETQTQRAVSNEKIAVEQRQISSRLKDLAEARNLAYEAMLLLNDKKYAESKEDVVNAYKLNLQNNGPLQNSDIYTAAQFNWTNAIQNKNQFAYHKYPVRGVANGNIANQILSVDESGLIYLSKASNGQLEPLASLDLRDEARSIATSPNGNRAVVITATGNAILLELGGIPSIKEMGRSVFQGIGKQVIFKNNNEVTILSNKGLTTYRIGENLQQQKFVNGDFSTLTYGSSSQLYVANGTKLSVYNHADQFPASVTTSFILPSKITSIAASADGSYLAVGTYEGGIWIKDLKSSKPASSFTPHASAIKELKFASVAGDVIQLASASSDQTIKLFDVKAVLNAKNAEDILTLRAHSKWVYCLWFTPDGKFLYSGSEDKRIIGWHTTMAGIYQFLSK